MAIQIEVENRLYYGGRYWRHHSAQAEQSDERVLLISFSQLFPLLRSAAMYRPCLEPRFQTRTVSAGAGSTHLPCSRIKSCNRSTASASGILNLTAVFPT